MSPAVPTIDVLRGARMLVANPNTWTKCASARSACGIPLCQVDDPLACRWCARGAIIRSAYRLGLLLRDSYPLFAALGRISYRIHCRTSIVRVNDEMGRLAALSVIDAAIAELEATP